jgi:hypothetical protein
MDQLSSTETHVFLGVFDFGDDLHAVTAIMEVEPTVGWLRGDQSESHPAARRTHSRWALHSRLPASACFEDHLHALLDQLEERPDRVRRVASEFRAVVWAAIYTTDQNPKMAVSPSAAGRLAALGLGIDFDLYHLPTGDDSQEDGPSN